jgi:hypothetical protein
MEVRGREVADFGPGLDPHRNDAWQLLATSHRSLVYPIT